MLTGVNRAHRANQFRGGIGLDEIAGGAGLGQCFDHVFLVIVLTQDQHSARGHVLANPMHRGEAADSLHPDVHHDDVRLQLRGQRDGLFAIRRFPDHVAFRREHHPEHLAKNPVIIGEQDPDARRIFQESSGH